MALLQYLINKLPIKDEGDAEFLPGIQSVTRSVTSPARTLAAWTICGFIAIVVLGSAVARVDVYAVAQGKTDVDGHSKVVQPMETGRVTKIYVAEGAHVDVGAPLIDLDAVAQSADRDRLQTEFETAKSEAQRHLVEMGGNRANIDQWTSGGQVDSKIEEREHAVLRAEQSGLQASVMRMEAELHQENAHATAIQRTIDQEAHLIDVLTERANMRESLARDGWDSRANLLDAQEALEREKANLVAKQGELSDSEANQAVLKEKIAEERASFKAQNAKEFETSGDKDLSTYQDLVKARDRVAQMTLRATTGGTVQQLAATTVGQVLNSGQQVMTIVPDNGKLIAVGFLKNEDIGFVKIGQGVTVKVESFPYTRYGTLKGTVDQISRDSVEINSEAAHVDTQLHPQPEDQTPLPKTNNLIYPVRVALQSDTMRIDGKDVRLKPGMNVTLEIKTADQSVLQFLFSPLIRQGTEAFHER